MTTFAKRLLGAATLDVATYEEVEADRSATMQALIVVVASSLATGIGASGRGHIVIWSFAALLGWVAWAFLMLQIGGQLLPEPQTRVDIGELLRTLGFATAPGLLRVFGVFAPSFSVPLFALTSAWMIVTMVVAVRQALDYTSTIRAVTVCLAGWLLAALFVLALSLYFTPSLT